jgi:GR25 family glycosyltransferase involved in LPS biosynthesis
MQATWNGVDKIYCISLINRTDRQAQARAQFARVGLAERVEFLLVDKHPTNCEQGIYESHLLCLKRGLAAGAERILIFEDDIVFDRVTPEILTRCMDFIHTHDRWHMLLLGCMVLYSRRTAYASILQVGFRSLTHACLIHRRFAEFLVRHPWQSVAYDDFLKDLKDRQTYALYPSIAFQSSSRSDNDRYLDLDRLRRFCGGLRAIQKRNEFYHRNKIAVISAHVLAAALLFLGAIR